MSGTTTARRLNGDLESVSGRCRLYLSKDKDWYIEFGQNDLAQETQPGEGGEKPAQAVWLNPDADITEVRLVKARKFLEKGCHPRNEDGQPEGRDSGETNKEYPSDPTTLGFRC